MKPPPLELLAHGTTGLAVGTGAGTAASSYYGWFNFVNDYAPFFGLVISCFFGSAGLFFYYLAWKKSILADKNEINLERVEAKFDSDIQEIHTEIKQILTIVQNTSTK